MGDVRTVLFLCPHNAAKSVIAAAYCVRLAAARGVTLRAASAGTDPDPGVSPLRSWSAPHGWCPWGVTSVISHRLGSSSSTGMTSPPRALTSRAHVP
jgi:hypothetical protein